MLTDAEKLYFIQACDAWSSLGESGMAVLAERMNVEHFQTGEVIVSEGEEADRIFVIAEGVVSVYLGGNGEARRRLITGELWGEFGLFSPWQRTATVKADEQCLLLSLSYSRFRDFIHEFPEVAIHLLERAITRLTKVEREKFETE